MMEIDIKEYLNNNEELINLIGKDNLYPIFTTVIDYTSLVYNFKHLTGGLVKQSQLELRIISNDYDFAKIIEGCLIKILDRDGAEIYIPYGNTFFRCELSGSGCLYRDDLQMYENTLFFIVKWRKIKNN